MHLNFNCEIEYAPTAKEPRRKMRNAFFHLAIIFTFLCPLFLTGCSSNEASRDFFSMDTVMHLSAFGDQAEQALADAESEINRLDHLFSISISDSDIARLNYSGHAAISDETRQLLERSYELSMKTDGAFDITIYPLSKLWGFYSGKLHIPTESELSSALQHVGAEHYQLNHNSVTLESGTQLDLGAIAKGYASAQTAKLIQDAGVHSANLSLGGNVHVVGTKPDGSDWTVAIADPADTARYAGTLKVRDTAVVTSGGYQRFFKENETIYHHILNPKTGYPAENTLLSVTVVSGDDVLADALSTALFVMGEDGAISFWNTSDLDFEMILITKDGKALCSEGLESSFTPAADHKIEVIRH